MLAAVRSKPANQHSAGVAAAKKSNATAEADETRSTRDSQPAVILIEGGRRVSGLFDAAENARACYVMAHGAGAGMTHPFLAAMTRALACLRVSVLRYQFPYMEDGSKRPDAPSVAHGAVRAAVSEASRLAPRLPLFAGGKSFGGRMTSQAQASTPLPGVRGLIFLGFPLHPPGKPSNERARHLDDVRVPMLFLQGSRDEFAEAAQLEPVLDRLGSRATLELYPEANHSFHAPKSAGRTDAATQSQMAQAIVRWIGHLLD